MYDQFFSICPFGTVYPKIIFLNYLFTQHTKRAGHKSGPKYQDLPTIYTLLLHFISTRGFDICSYYAFCFLAMPSNTANTTTNATAPAARPINPFCAIPATKKPTQQGTQTVKA